MKKKKNIIQPRAEEGIPVEVYRTAKPLFDSIHEPEFSVNNPTKPTGMAKRIVEAVGMKLHELNFRGDGTPQLSAAVQQNEQDAAKNDALLYNQQESTKVVHFSTSEQNNNKAFTITPAEFYERLGIANSNKQKKEFQEQLLILGKTPYKFSWPYMAANGKKMRAEKETPFFFVEQHFEQLDKPKIFTTTNKDGKEEQHVINEVLEFYVIEPGHVCWLGADAPAEEVNRNKPVWVNQAHFPTEHLTAGQKALFNFFFGKFQEGKAAATKKKQQFNPVRKYEAIELLQHMNINTASPSFKKNKAREMKRLEEALIVFKEEGWLQSWELSGNEVRIVFPSALLEGGMA